MNSKRVCVIGAGPSGITAIKNIADLYSIFVNKDGKMKKELSYDGVHLNDKGYSVWVDYIKPTVLNLANHN